MVRKFDLKTSYAYAKNKRIARGCDVAKRESEILESACQSKTHRPALPAGKHPKPVG